jgi:type II secretory pathway component PulF
MPNFDYRALNITTRETTNGIIGATHEMEARQKLRELGLVPLALTAVKDYADDNGSVMGIGSKLGSLFKKVGSKDIIAFSRNLAIMVRGGIPLTEALLYFENFSESKQFKRILNSVRSDIMAGDALSDALGRFPDQFSSIYLNVTRAGENSGELDVTMERIADLMGRQEKIKAKVISTSIYPTIVLCICFIVLVVIFTFVLPAFAKIYKQMGLTLPAITQLMVFISDMFVHYWFIVFPLLGATGWFISYFVKTPMGKGALDKTTIRIPILKEVVRFSNVSQFISTLAVCFNSGIPITEALNYATATVGNLSLKSTLESVSQQVQTGRRMGVALAETGVVPELVLLVLVTGEESGNLEQSLNTAQEYLEKEINQLIDILMSFMEPLLLLFLGVVVGFLALAIYMPMFSMYEKMGG